MLELIVVPLYSAAESQQNLAAIALKFYKRIAFYQKDKNPDNKKATGVETRILCFKVKRSIEQNGKVKTLEQTIKLFLNVSSMIFSEE